MVRTRRRFGIADLQIQSLGLVVAFEAHLEQVRQLEPSLVVGGFDPQMIAEPVRRLGILALDDQDVLAWIRRRRGNVSIGEDRLYREYRGAAHGAVDCDGAGDGDGEAEDRQDSEGGA